MKLDKKDLNDAIIKEIVTALNDQLRTLIETSPETIRQHGKDRRSFSCRR